MSPFIEQLGWVLIHSLWQLALLAAAAFVTQRAMRRTSAAARYATLLAILVLVVAAPLITWSVLPTQAAIPVADLPDPVPVRASEPAPQLKPVAPALAPAPVTVESTPPITAVTPVPPVPVVPAKAPEPLKPSWSQWAQQSITPWLSTIVWGWSLGVLAFAIRPLWSWFTVRQLRTQGVSPVSESVQAALAETARRLGMTQAVRVLQSTIVQVPIVAGYLKPVILLPASIVTGLPASQLEAILAHELAHIRRHDYLANLIQTLVETVFFYHPAVWWLSHQIRCERENCCDDIAVAMLGNRLDYSRALLAVEELRGAPTTLAVGASGGSLLGRVRRLFHRDVEQLRLSNGSITLCGLIGIGLIALATVASTNHDRSSELFFPGAKAEIDGFGTIEVLGLRFVDSEWWSPDGSNLSASVDLGDPIRHLFNDDPLNGRQIGIVTRFSGVDSPRHSRVRLKSNRTGSSGSWSSQERRRAEQNQITDIRFCSTNLSPDALSGELTVLLSFDAWSPWYTIDLKSPEASQNQGPLAPVVGRTPSSLASTECEIGLQFKSGVHEEIHFEQVALDAAGNEIPSRGVVGNKHLGLKHYAVPESQVAKLRYRFQRFTHEVRFRDISLKAGRQTEPQARVQVLHRPVRPAAFSEPATSLSAWPQLGGSAAHNPISPITNLPTQFHPDRQENIRWSQPIGDFAFSSPVVSGGKVLIGTNNAIGRDPQFPASIDRACLQCFDERTGEFLWQYSSPKMEQGRRHDWPSIGICSTPVIEGDRVWFATNRCEIVCLDLNGHRDNEDDGEPEASAPGEAARTLTPNPSPGGRGEPEMQRADVVWKYDLFNTLGVRPLNATCVTPVIAGDLLLLNSGNDVDESYQTVPAPEAPAFLAFHKTTGQLIWSDKTPNPNILGNGCSMGAPAVAKIDGVWQAIFAGYDGWLYAFDLESIQRSETLLLWKFDLNPKESQYRLSGPRNEFSYRGLPTTPVVVGNHVFAAVGHNPERGEGLGRLWCIDATQRGDLSSDLVYNKSAPDGVIPHKRVQACEADKGDFTRPNPNSGVEWVYTTDDLNKNGQIEFEEQMHLSNSLPAIHDGLLLTTDLSGLVHCLDVTTGELLWTHDQLANCWSGPLLADGKAWIIDEDGDLSIFALSREKQLIAEIAMNSPGYTNLAAANQTLYVATKTQLVAIGSGAFPKLNGVTAKLPGGLEIELVGVTPNAAPTSEGWRADGSLIEGAGNWPRGATFSNDGDLFTITTDGASKLPPNPLARDLLFESRGLRSHPSWVILNQKGWTQFESVNADETIRRRLSYLPKESGQPLTVEMALTDSPWGPWQRIDKSGKRINTIETFEPDRKLYEDIQIVRLSASRDTDSSDKPLHLVLVEPATHDDYQSGVFDIEVRFVDKNGKVWKTFARPAPPKDGRRLVTWATGGPVPLESLAYAEFRLRPYRHFIAFKNVPLDRTPGAQVAVEHRSLPLPPTHVPDPRFTAKVPGGIEIELLRIVRNDLPEDQSLTPDGKPSPGHLDWPQRSHYKVQPDGNGYSSSNEGPGSYRAWDFAYEVRSAGSKPFVSVDVVGEGSTSSSQFLPAIGPRLVTVLPKVPESLTTFQLRVGTEEWGEWIQVGADGEILNPEAMSKSPNSPEKLVTVAGAGLDAENLDRSWIKWLALPNGGEYYQMEVRAIDDDGKIVESRSSSTGPRETTKSFELPLDRLARFEYRLRPYRHLVRFDQICTDPAKPTEVKVSVEPIVYPNEVAAPSELKTSKLQLLNPNGTPWQGNLTKGHVGFTAPDAKAWNTWVGKDGRANLTQLPEGPHWLITSYPFSAIPIETPLKQSPLKLPLRLGAPSRQHSSSNYSAELKLNSDGRFREFIEILVTNSTDELLSFSELDLSLEAGWLGQESQAHSPRWLENDLTKVKQLEIPAGRKGMLRLDWNDWVKRGIWDPMSGPQTVSKPALPEQQPGKIWVRIQGPGFGTIPVALTHPEKFLAAGDEPTPQPPPLDENQLGPRIDLIGLTYDSVPKKETWNTNGQPLPAPEWVQQLPKLYGDDKSKPAPLYLFEVHGLRAKPSFRHRYQPAVVSGDDEVPEGRPYRMAVLYEDLKDGQYLWGEHPAVRITDEPWGPWRTITKEGQFAEPVDPNTLYREGYDMVTLHGFRPLTKKPNDPELAADAVRTGLVLKHPMDYDALYAIEIEAVPSTAGPQLVNVFTSRPVQRFRNEAKDRWDVESEWPVDPTKIDHLRYRIRPYRHRFEFQEVAYKQYERPATSAPFKVIHTKLEHDLPRQMHDLPASPKPLAGVWGPASNGLRSRLTLLDDAPHVGSAKVRVELWNEGDVPQEIALDPRKAGKGFVIQTLDGKQVRQAIENLPVKAPRDTDVSITIPPGKTVTLLDEFDLGYAFFFQKPAEYQLRFGGECKFPGVVSEDFPESNTLKIDLTDGPRPEFQRIRQLLIMDVAENGGPHWRGPSVIDDHTFVFRRLDYVYVNQVVLQFTDSVEPAPLYVPEFPKDVPTPKARDVLLGKTKLGFAHLQIPELADKEWTKCEEQIRGRMSGELILAQAPEGDHTKPAAVQDANTDERLEGVIATLPGGLELELLGVTPYREPGQESWAPDGKKFEPAPDWASRLKVATMPPDGIDSSDGVKEDYRDFIVRVRGFKKEQRALLPFSGPTMESGDSTIGPMSVLTWNQQVQRLRIGLPGEWGPYRVLTADSKVSPKTKAVNPPGEVPAPYRKVYDSIQLRLEASDAREERWGKPLMKSLPPDFKPGDPDPDFEPGSRVRLVWKGIPTNPDLKYATHEAVVIDLEGQPHGVTATSAFIEPEGGHQWDVDIFDVPIRQVSHIEYRLRPYQHVVTFNNVALHPGVECGPNVVVESPLAVAAKPPATLEFRVVATAAKKDPIEFAGQKWLLIAGEAGKPVAGKSALGLPVERLNAGNEYMGLLGDTPATSMPWDGTWHVEKCEVQPDPNGEDFFQINVTLDASGGKALRTLTTNALRQRLAVIVEDRILVAPIVQEAIGTTFVITGNFTKEQAEQFAKSIRRGMAQVGGNPDNQRAVQQPVELQVVDAETGKPITGAEVTVRQTISSWQPKRPANLNISIANPESLSTLRTNATGHFSFTTPPEMRDWQSDLQISIRHPDYVIEQSFGAFHVTPEMKANPELLKEKRYPNGIIKLNPGHEISGQILGPDGKPAEGVKLYAAWQMPQYLGMPPHAVTDAQGRYKFRTVKETESDLIFAIPQDAVAVSFPLRKKYGEHPPIQLERGTVITGQVLGQDGQPLAGAVVQANGSDSVYDGFPKPIARVLTDSEGRYRLPLQKLPVDVRVSSLGWMGGWQPRGRDLTIDEVFLPVMVRDERREGREESQTGKTPGADASGSGALTLDFRPCEAVTLTAQVYDEKGQPATDCELAVFGTAPDSQRAGDKLRSTWRGRFHAIPDQPGLFRVKAPKGLVNATLVDPEIPTGPRQKWTREVRAGEKLDGPRTESGWEVLDRDDHSIVVGAPSPSP